MNAKKAKKKTKQVQETIQDLKIEAIKNTHTDRIREMEIPGKETGITNTKITNGIQKVEQRISGIEDTI